MVGKLNGDNRSLSEPGGPSVSGGYVCKPVWRVERLGGNVRVSIGPIRNNRVELLAGAGRSLYVFPLPGDSAVGLEGLTVGPLSSTPGRDGPYAIEEEILGLTNGDIDRDGVEEIVIGSADSVAAYKWQGGTYAGLWRSPATGRVDFASVIVGDVDGDRSKEIIAGGRGSSYLVVFKSYGRSYRRLSEQDIATRIIALASWEFAYIILRLRVIVALVTEDEEFYIRVFQWDGRRLVETWRSKKFSDAPSAMTVQDLNGDGSDEVVLVTGKGSLYVLGSINSGLSMVASRHDLPRGASSVGARGRGKDGAVIAVGTEDGQLALYQLVSS